MSVPDIYQYQPLQAEQIRLIQFLGEENGIISGNMETFDLRDKSGPQYRALSYVWSLDGNPIVPTDFIDNSFILVQNQRVPVLESLRPLFDALKTKDTLKDGMWWWIDCICINQLDNQEKGHQVRLMGLIYELAVETVVWLGDRSDDSDFAMDFIEFLHELLQKTSTDQELQKYLRDNPEPAKWNALQNLLLRRWWTRVWTFQEYALAKSVSFWCGQKSVPRVAVSNALFVVDRGRASGFDDTENFYISWNRRRVQLLHESKCLRSEVFSSFPMSLPALVAYSSNNQATNDRDRLYGLYGLSTDTDLLEVDYDLSIARHIFDSLNDSSKSTVRLTSYVLRNISMPPQTVHSHLGFRTGDKRLLLSSYPQW
jgi:Heterokaryon incompatibility protein (HET)